MVSQRRRAGDTAHDLPVYRNGQQLVHGIFYLFGFLIGMPETQPRSAGYAKVSALPAVLSFHLLGASFLQEFLVLGVMTDDVQGLLLALHSGVTPTGAGGH